jgi:hypothetical protein
MEKNGYYKKLAKTINLNNELLSEDQIVNKVIV